MGELGGAERHRKAKLSYIEKPEIDRASAALSDPVEQAVLFAEVNRFNTLYMIMRAGSGHIGTSLSAMDIASWIWLRELENPNQHEAKHSDIYFSSKGHDAPGLYAILIALGKLPSELMHMLRRHDGLPGHPDVRTTPHIATNTGSLGMGISKARGMALARRLQGKTGRIFVLTGDGELQEGQFWESLQPTANRNLSEITVIIDHNKIQSDTWVKDVSDLGDLEQKLAAFGWYVDRVDGNDIRVVAAALMRAKAETERPQIIIADTVKGKGISFMERVNEENFYKFHSGAPSVEDYDRACTELLERINGMLAAAGAAPITVTEADMPERSVPANAQKLIRAYSEELVAMGEKHPEIVDLDADLLVDTGQLPFKQAFPDRFIEAGIAEQDMVSMAGGLALSGALPIVNSYACFMMPRANEQMYNNATEGKKIIYIASLAGLLPGGPGHSHQSVRDIAITGANPGLTILEPSNEAETKLALRYAVEENQESTYIRLVSIPVVTPYELPASYALSRGKGVMLREGKDVLLISYGPVMLSEAVKAADALATRGITVGVMNLPWLNAIDDAWLSAAAAPYSLVVSIDNHYVTFGQGTLVGASLAKTGVAARFAQLGVEEIPDFGANDEVLKHHGLDADGITRSVERLIVKA